MPEAVTIPYAHASHETEKAFCCHLRGSKRQWIPKSVVLAGSRVRHKGDRGPLVIERWFAERRRLTRFINPPLKSHRRVDGRDVYQKTRV
jgi:hypothetical protein